MTYDKVISSPPFPRAGGISPPSPGTPPITKGDCMKRKHPVTIVQSPVPPTLLQHAHDRVTWLVPGEVLVEDADLPGFRQFRAQPILALMQAVLMDALVCFHRQCTTEQLSRSRQQNEAEQWLFSNDVHWPFAFLRVCDALGLDPSYLRQKILQWHVSPSRTSASYGRWDALTPKAGRETGLDRLKRERDLRER